MGGRRGNTLTLRWVPSHLGIEGNEVADDWAKRAAEDQGDSVPRAYLRETSFAHMTRRVTEARTAGVFVCNQLFTSPLHAARRAMAAVVGFF